MLIVVYRVVHKLTPFIIYFWEWANNSWPCDRPGSWWLWLSWKAFYPQSCNTWVPKNLEPQAIDGHLMSSFKISFIPNGEYINLLSHLSLVWRPFILLAEIRTNSAKLCPKLRYQNAAQGLDVKALPQALAATKISQVLWWAAMSEKNQADSPSNFCHPAVHSTWHDCRWRQWAPSNASVCYLQTTFACYIAVLSTQNIMHRCLV